MAGPIAQRADGGGGSASPARCRFGAFRGGRRRDRRRGLSHLPRRRGDEGERRPLPSRRRRRLRRLSARGSGLHRLSHRRERDPARRAAHVGRRESLRRMPRRGRDRVPDERPRPAARERRAGRCLRGLSRRPSSPRVARRARLSDALEQARGLLRALPCRRGAVGGISHSRALARGVVSRKRARPRGDGRAPGGGVLGLSRCPRHLVGNGSAFADLALQRARHVRQVPHRGRRCVSSERARAGAGTRRPRRARVHGLSRRAPNPRADGDRIPRCSPPTSRARRAVVATATRASARSTACRSTRFRRSRTAFTGSALRAGQLAVANCASCHGVHDILPSSDPRSHVSSANLPNTCGKCHPGRGQPVRHRAGSRLRRDCDPGRPMDSLRLPMGDRRRRRGDVRSQRARLDPQGAARSAARSLRCRAPVSSACRARCAGSTAWS